jgi:hypothetical protein
LWGCCSKAREREKEGSRGITKGKGIIPIKMLKAIPDPEKTTTEADIELQLQEALVSTIAAINPSLDKSFCTTNAIEATEDAIALQADYIPFDVSDIEWDYLGADDDADTGLF